MVKRLLIMLLVSLPLQAYAVETVPDTKPPKEALYDDLTANMACRCGCGTTLKTCPHENCSFAVPARKELKKFIDQGMGREEIKAKMVALHGEAILAQPMFKGFNIMGWITPFVAILLVGYLVALIAKKWSSQEKAPAKTSKGPENDDPYLAKMREELDKFEGK